MKQTMAAAFIAVIAGHSASASDFVDIAPVIAVTPMIERVSEPRQECYRETSVAPQRAQERSMAAPILGGLAGALLGRQVGSGNGRDVATAVGAAAGAMAGDSVANPGSQRSYTGAAAGAVTGGLLGSQVGNGSGKGASVAAGTIAGAMIGDRVATRQSASAQPVQRCRTVESVRDIVKGYSVVYRYNGRDISTVLPYDPGNTVRVGVGIIGESVADSGRDHPRVPASNYTYRY